MNGGRRKWKAERKKRDGPERAENTGKRQKDAERSVEPLLLWRRCIRRSGPVLTVAVPPHDVYRSGSGRSQIRVIDLWCWGTTTEPVDDVQSED